ncbi:type I glyceraldehyde-3-phosphate dehydrogenase [Candidatus Uhrbacteria bacterium]|nr:type I glyceraldehyde-3-phosphate dehydrogenase [Candidatus Uhrbacteria bacterium]
MIRIAINGFGRIGRAALRAAWDRPGIEIVAINDLTDPVILAHLLQYDTVYRRFEVPVRAVGTALVVGGKKIPVTAEKDPAMLPWKKWKVDVVIESTGFFTKQEGAQKHIEAGAKRVVISAPGDGVPTVLMGVNHKEAKGHEVVSNASCTTNSIAPVAQIMEEEFGIKKAMMTTIHAVTAGQNVVDGVPAERKPDMRRARAAYANMVPTSTGAAKATTEAIPSLKEKFDGIAVRVPVIDVSLSDFTFLLKKNATPEKVNDAFKAAAKSARWKGILAVTDEPLVSSDFIGSPFSSIVDLEMTRVVDGDLVKVLAWYDNEWGYTMRLIDMVEVVGKGL